jgi:hypothetical protein
MELIVALDTVLDKKSPIYSFRREQNGAAHDLALALLAECTAIWKEGGGPNMRLSLLDKASWSSLSAVMKSMDSTGCALRQLCVLRLCTGVEIVESELEKPEWKDKFLSKNGFAEIAELVEELHDLQIRAAEKGSTETNMLRVTGLPIVLRVLRLCTGVEGQLSQSVLSLPMTASAMARACELILLLSANEIKPAGMAHQLSDGAVEEISSRRM